MEHVKVYIYDISKGLARSLSQGFLGKQIDGVWHTGIVVYGQEYYFGGLAGIEAIPPGTTMLGAPDQVVDLGPTEIPFEIFMEHLSDLSQTSFRPDTYDLFNHNCNNFSDEVAHFLSGKNIPSHITALPQEVLNTPFGGMIAQFMNNTQVNPGGGNQLFPSTQATSPQPKATQVPIHTNSPGASCSRTSSSGAVQSPNTVRENVDTVVYKPDKVSEAYLKGKSTIGVNMNSTDKGLLDEVCEYINISEPMWSLSREHFKLLAKLIQSKDLSEDSLVVIGDLLLRAVLIEEALMVLKHDTECTIQKLFAAVEDLDLKRREIISKSVCNICSSKAGLSWMSSSKPLTLSSATSNNKLMVNTCTTGLLDDNDLLGSIGAALARNITIFTNDADITSELGPALIQMLMVKEPDHETAKRCLQALNKCIDVSPEVAGIAAVMGLSLDQGVYKSNQTLTSLCASIKEKMAYAQ